MNDPMIDRLTGERLYNAYTMTESEIIIAGSVAVQRYAQNLCRGKKEMYGAPDYMGFQYMMDGAIGEMAAAAYFNRYWNGSIGNLTAKDVDGVQVRTTRRRACELILHDQDNDQDVFVLLQIDRTLVKFVGWCFGWEGKHEDFWRDDVARPAFFVPEEAYFMKRIDTPCQVKEMFDAVQQAKVMAEGR